jgi:hypothetical protein
MDQEHDAPRDGARHDYNRNANNKSDNSSDSIAATKVIQQPAHPQMRSDILPVLFDPHQ